MQLLPIVNDKPMANCDYESKFNNDRAWLSEVKVLESDIIVVLVMLTHPKWAFVVTKLTCSYFVS